MNLKHEVNPEEIVLQSFIQNRENTMKLVITNSVGMALRKLNQIYFSAKGQPEVV